LSISVFQKSASGVKRIEGDNDLAIRMDHVVWVDLMAPDKAEEAAVEAAFGIDAPSETERAALEESARFYIEKNVLVLNATVMARVVTPTPATSVIGQSTIQHHRQIVSFFLTSTTLVTVRACPLKAFEINAGRASANLADDDGASDILVSLLESLVERAADYLSANAGELEALNAQVLIGHRQVRLETVLRRLGQLGAGASQTRDSLASLSRLVRFALGHGERFNLPKPRLSLLATDIDTLQRQAEAFQADLTFSLEATLGLVSSRQNDTLKVMAIATLIFVPPTLIASVFGMNFEAMSVFKDSYGPWLAVGAMALSSLVIVSLARLGKWL
jgi:magnesium transporter